MPVIRYPIQVKLTKRYFSGGLRSSGVMKEKIAKTAGIKLKNKMNVLMFSMVFATFTVLMLLFFQRLKFLQRLAYKCLFRDAFCRPQCFLAFELLEAIKK